MKKTEELINSLSKDLRPVRPIESLWKRIFRWICVALASLLVSIALLGTRENLGIAVRDGMWWLHTILMALLAISSAISAFVFSVPGKDRSKVIRWAPLFSLLAWALAVFGGAFQSSQGAGVGLMCLKDIMVIGAIPGMALFVMIMQGVVFKRPLAGVYCFLAIAALGSLGTQFICMSDSPLHLLVWHFLPVFLLGLIGSFVGKFLFKRS